MTSLDTSTLVKSGYIDDQRKDHGYMHDQFYFNTSIKLVIFYKEMIAVFGTLYLIIKFNLKTLLY